QYRSVLIGGILITAGHFTLAYPSLPSFYTGLVLIVLGTGMLKPNVSTMVGSLYDAQDTRRDAGFSIFYMGINLGAVIGPLIAGYLAQRVNWHAGFACAGVGMTLGLIQYVLGRKHLMPALNRLNQESPKAGDAAGSGHPALTSAEWKRILSVFVFFAFACVFWAGYEQAGSTLNLFADRYTRLSVFGYSFPSSWFQSVPAFFVIVLAPVFAWLWIKLGPREPSSPAKFTIGLFFIGVSFLVLMLPGSAIEHNGGAVRVSPWWLVGVYLLQEFGELSLSPVGLSLVTKLAPRRVVGLMMGVWFLSIAFGNFIGSKLAGFFPDPSAPGRVTMSLTALFGASAVAGLAAAFVLFFLIKPVRKLMGGIH
ncbi:MAG TPA: peptide MFS transporter, partial [Acidobacteriota bacterium]|nr:peptide MFS transporter [Acidobacteriota bacterium]